MKRFILYSLSLAISLFAISQTPVAYYPLNANANDISGNALNGTITGTVTPVADRFGNANRAVSFNGASRIDVADNPLLRPENVSLSAWVYFTSTPGTQIIANKNLANSTHESYAIFFFNGNIAAAWGSAGAVEFITGPVPAASQWHFVAMTFDDANNLASLYLDGVLVNSKATNLSLGYDNSPFSIATELENGSYNFFYNGVVDEVKIYNTALTGAQVQQAFQEQPNYTATMTTDGNTTFASTPSGMMEGATDFTIETWIKTTENKSDGTFFLRPTIIGNNRGAFADNDISIFTNGGNIGMYCGLGTENVLQTTVSINNNQWHHVAVVRTGTTLNLYVDGINIGNTVVGSTQTLNTADAPLTIGAASYNFGVPGLNAAGITAFHQGEFAETRFSNNARYTANFTPANSFTADANTVALYHYGACQREICTDASSNTNFLSGRFSAPTCATELPFTNAITYNGVDQSAFLPTGVMNGLTNFTVEGWVKSSDINTSVNSNLWQAPIIFSEENPSAASGDLVLVTQAGYIGMTYEGQGGGVTSDLAKYFISDNQWHHWAVSADGTTVRFFVDGMQQGSRPVSGGLTIGAADKFALMGDDNLNTYVAKNHSGLLEEVRFSNTGRYSTNFTPPTGIFTSDANTIALYHSDDCPGNMLTDASVNNHHASLQNFSGNCQSVASQKPGSGNAISFDGTDDVVTIPNGGALNGLQTGTIEMWVKWNGTNQPSGQGMNGAVMARQSDGQFSNQIIGLSGPDPNTSGIVWRPYASAPSAITSTISPGEKWNHLTITYSSGAHTMYLNGIQVGSSNSSGSIATSTVPLAFGRWLNGGGFGANADIDEVRIWNTTLSEAQIRDRMCQKITSADPLYTNLAAYYNFDESTGSTAFDGSANANYGSLANGPTRVTSGAAIGNSSAHNYVTTGLPTANLSFNGQDNLAVAYTAGTFTGEAGTHVYAVSEAPNSTSGITEVGTNNRYFGVFNANLSSPTYTATYNYSGNPFVTTSNEQLVTMFKRNDNAASTWTNSTAVLNATANTLTATGQNTEYMLGLKPLNQELKPGSGIAISFDGVNDHITTGSFLIPTIGDFTTEMWVYNRDNTAGFNEFISQGASGDAFYIGTTNGTGIIRLGDKWQSTGIIMPLNKWVHLAVVKNGNNGTFYLNGIQVATQSNYSISAAGTHTLIGQQYGGLNEVPDADLDEVRIWNTPLTQSQIRDRMCRKITSGDDLYANLVGYYNFDESTGITAFDGSANGNNGTLVNGPTRVTSGAAIGNTSAHNYVTTGLPATNLSFNAQDNLAVAYTSGTFTGEAGTHVYAVSEAPNTTSGITEVGTNNRYFGVFNANLSSPAYTATYNYTGNPFVTASNEPLVGLYKRNDNAATTWSITTAAQNVTDNTLTAFGQNTEYMLGSQNSICGCANEGGTLTLTAPAGMVITGIAFASYGLPTGDCGSYAPGSCHAVNSKAIVESIFLNKNTASIGANNGVFGDPCIGAGKRLCVQAIYGPATVNSPGSVGTNQVVCSNNIPALLTNITSAIGNTANPVVYQWQDSTVGASWQDIASANTETYQSAALPLSTWFRRKVTIGDYTGFTNEVAITVTPIAGDTTVFPLNTWNVYAFNGSDLELGAGTAYRGFYSLNTLNLNSQSDWASNTSPSSATGYQGCSVNTDQFTWVYKRKGFTEGDYIVNSNGVDDVARILVNGTVVYQTTGFGTFGNISLGHLDANSTIEIRCIEATGPAYANFDFMLSSLQAGTIGGNQSICTGNPPNMLTHSTAGFGGPSLTLTYQWQDSTVGSSWQNINLATNLTYQPPALNKNTWYRRMALSGSATAPSNEIAIEVLTTGPAIIPGITVNNRILTASSLANGTIGYQWFKDNILIGGATNQTFTVPNNDAGQYSVAYTNACGAGVVSAPVAVAIAKTDQTITFTPVPAKAFGDAAFEVTASASSTLPITAYSLVSGPATLSGNMVTITGAGTIVVKAIQDGNATFNAAENTLQIDVAKAAATIVLSNLTAIYDGAGKQATAVTNPLGLNFALAYNGSATLPVSAADYNVLATITSPNYQGSTTGTLVIGKANQTINLTNPGNKSYNDIPFGIAATATSALPVSLSILTIPATGVASIAGNTISLLGQGGTVTITASQEGNTNYNPATNATASFEVRPPEAKDLQITTLLSPLNGCTLGVLGDITIRLRNTGTLPASGFPVSYRIGSDPVVVETFTGTIAPGANADFTFATKGIFAQTGVNYQLNLNVSLDGDEIPGNNTLLAAIARYAPATMSISSDTAICAGGEATLKTFGAGSTQWTGGPANAVYKVSPLVATTYTAQVTDVNGCKTETLSVKVTVNANPVVDAGTDQTILRGSSATLTASGADTYLWSNGVTTAENTVSPQTTNTYSVKGTNTAGCTSTDQVQVVVNFSAITVSPGVVQFGGVVVNNTANTFITITNTGTLPEDITSFTGLSNPFTTSQVLPVTLPAGTSIQVPVAFKPTATLIYQNKINIVTSAGTFSVTIRGTGANPAPAWTVTPASYNYGKVAIGSNVTQNFAVKNTGNVPIRISSISSTSTRFVGSTSGVLDIPVGATINLAIRFNPTAIAAYTASISVRGVATNLPLLRAIVAGNGIIPGDPPELDFVNRAPYDGNSGVTPPVGNPGVYTYSVLYRHPQGTAPMAGFPKVGIDKNNDEDFVDDNEGLFSMLKEGTGTNWLAGETYTFTTNLTVSELYGYQFFATDVNGNEAELTQYKKGPIVSREVLDLHIFASDIVFSKPNPAVNEDFTVTATINNNSPYSVADIPVRFYYKDSLFLFDDIIPFIDGRSKVSITRTLNFSPDGFYPIKIWIDSSQTLGEGNLLNNYASRPVIVGDFTVPGTIDLVSNATPSGCTKGSITFSGRATYRGLNLAGTPPVEGAEVIITIPGYEGGRVLKTTTDINGNWYIHDDPCANDVIDPEDCTGYQCGVTYNYTVEVTDFTLTSPVFASSVTRPCVPCDRVGRLRSGIGASGCILENKTFTVSASLTNYEYDFATNRKLCAPSIFNDTITLYVDGQLVNTFTLDSLTTCGDAAFTHAATGLSVGNHQVSMNHVYYFANGDRVEESHSGGFVVLPIITDIEIGDGIIKTGHTSFVFGEKNKTCGVPAGPHTVYLYDSLPGYTEKVLIKTYTVASLLPDASIGFSYSNPDMETGNHYITAYTDEDGEIPELREDNNMMKAVFYVQEPDIVVEELNISSGAVIAGSLINFTAKISNAGSPINKPFKVQFRVNGGLLGGNISIPSLGTGESEVVVSAPFTVPVSLCPVEVVAYGDIDNEIVEVEEIKNNTDTTLFGVNINAGRSCTAETEETVGAGFFNEEDILGTIQCTPYISPKGVLTYFATTVRNTGSRDVRNVRVQFKLEGVELGTDVIPLLKAGEKAESGFYYAFDTVGRFIINAFADYTREVCETNEKDNIGNIHVDIKKSVADLEILSQYIAPSNLNPSPGQTITVVSSVVNKGDAPSTPTTMRFWVDDVQLGVDIPIDSLYPGMDTTVMATLTYSNNIVGPKIIKVRADIANTVIERTKRNNEATRAIIVGAAPDFANAISEAITLSPTSFNVGDEITIRNYIRNYGGDAGAAWMRFYYRNAADEKILIDSLRFGLESNDSARISMKWTVIAGTKQIITEIAGSLPPEFNEENNIDSLLFSGPLPLNLLSFNGTIRNEEADLSWRTSSEINVKHFELERSADGSRFDNVAILKASNTSGQHDYRYTDAGFSKLIVPNVYYRLRMVDLDGSYKYSKVVRLAQPNRINTVKVYPNPVKDMLQIQVQSAANGDFTLRVVDAQGRLMLSRKYGVTTGPQILSLPVQTLAKGWYVLVMMQADGTMREVKIIKE